MDKLYELLKESVLVQATIALATLTVILYMYATGKEVPDNLVSFFMLVIGYYFGNKTQQQIYRK